MYTAAGYYAAVIMIWLTILISPGSAEANPESFAEPDPPWSMQDVDMEKRRMAIPRAVIPSVEWEYHKTADNLHDKVKKDNGG